MKQVIKFFVVCFLTLNVVACSKPHWEKTHEGYYFYSETNRNSTYEWDGGTIGPIIQGKGTLTEFDKNGYVLNKTKCNANFGLLGDNNLEYKTTVVGKYLGEQDDNLPDGFGVLFAGDSLQIGKFKDGRLYSDKVYIYLKNKNKYEPLFIGRYRKGQRNGIGQLYSKEQIIYDGEWKKGLRHGYGKEYVFVENTDDKRTYMQYEGEWKKDLYDGYGTFYNSHIKVYQGEWAKGLYHGKGTLIDNGECIDGKWKKGVLSKNYFTTKAEQVVRTTKYYFSGELEDQDSIQLQRQLNKENMNVSQQIFIDSLQQQIFMHVSEELTEQVENRFGGLQFIRMIFAPIFSDAKRIESAEKYFCKNLTNEKIQNTINAKIDLYNLTNKASQLNYVSINPIEYMEIVDSKVAQAIFDRESLEWADILVDALITSLIVFVLAFILGFLIGMFIPTLLPYVAIIDIVCPILAFIISFCVSVFVTGEKCVEMENLINQMLIDNYMTFINNQDIIFQILLVVVR